MSKFIPILVLILIIGFALYQGRFELPKTLFSFFGDLEEGIAPEETGPEEEIPLKEEFLPSERAEKFYISGGKALPVFTKEVIVDPFKVKEGEEQIFSIWAKDTQGIESVVATITTDTGDELIELELVEGTKEEGKWVGSWTTKNISSKTSYSTNFEAINEEGKDTKMSLFWQAEE